MSATTIQDEQVFQPRMNAIIIYDKVELAADAHALLARAADRADAASLWSIRPWRVDMLMTSPAANAALADASDAHLIVIAVHNESEIPVGLLNWLENWVANREVQDAALAVFSGRKGARLSAPATPALSGFAKRHGLSFIIGDVRPDENLSDELLDNLHERQVTVTPTLQHILEQAPRGYYHHWGINE